MQLITFLSMASAMVATVSAKTAVELMKDFTPSQAGARVINRCDYDVHLWSILHSDGCPTDGMVTLKKGETYSENLRNGTDVTGISIKISKTESCKGNDIVQLEYFLNHKAGYEGNYLDVSYVDCLEDDCPTKQEGYYLKAGSQTGASTASAGNTWCPILACHDAASCAKMSYVLPDDVQTKTCGLDDSMDFYMCGGNAPTEDYESTPEEPETPQYSAEPSVQSSAQPTASSTEEAEYSAPAPTPSEYSTTDVEASAVTPAPEVTTEIVNGGLTKTQVVYVTQYEYVNAKRHAHDHARRHQPFHA